MTGTVAKGAIWIAEKELKAKGGPALALATSFFAGSLTSGMLSGYVRSYEPVFVEPIAYFGLGVLLQRPNTMTHARTHTAEGIDLLFK
jgi:hypothetical protein